MNDRVNCRFAGAIALAAGLSVGGVGLATAADSASPPPRRTADPALVRTLQSHHWTLQSAGDGSGRPIEALTPAGRAVVMSFVDAQLTIQGACNQMSGAWRLSPRNELTIGRLASTMKACEPALMAADKALADAMAQPLAVELTPGAAPSLRLSTASQQTLTFSGERTLRSLYGAPRRLFLEVAPQLVDCPSSSGRTDRCLQVREVRFDAQGLRQGSPGSWRPFTERIEGFTHTPGVRNVLRIDRYERKPAPADAPAVRYVLDLVVESETQAPR